MGTLSTWEALILGGMVLLLIFWFRPGIKASMERSRNAKKDWPALLWPIGMVVLFVILLIMMV